MTILKITVSERRLSRLEDKARRLRVTPETLLEASLEELITRSDREFQQAVSYVLAKNADLYRHLAEGA